MASTSFSFDVRRRLGAWTINIHDLTVLAIWVLPLFIGGSTGSRTGNLRILVVLVIALIALAYNTTAILNTLKQLPRVVFASLLLLIAAIIVSSVHAGGLASPNVLIGQATGQFGPVLWLSFIVIALNSARFVQQALFSSLALGITLIVGIFSLFVGKFELLHGLRLGGLMYQPTTMGMYSCLAVIIAFVLLQKQVGKYVRVMAWLVLVVHTAIIVLTQSRISWLCLIIILAVNAWLIAKAQRTTAIAACAMIMLLILLPISFQNYFSRYRQESVMHGSSYRLELYETVSKEILRHDKVVGSGTQALPADLNNRQVVPEDVARTLDQGYTFLSAHNMFLDLAYYFGLAATLGLIVVIVFGLRLHASTAEVSLESLNFGLLFATLLANALVNIPSIELTPLFFIVILGLFKSRLHG